MAIEASWGALPARGLYGLLALRPGGGLIQHHTGDAMVQVPSPLSGQHLLAHLQAGGAAGLEASPSVPWVMGRAPSGAHIQIIWSHAKARYLVDRRPAPD